MVNDTKMESSILMLTKLQKDLLVKQGIKKQKTKWNWTKASDTPDDFIPRSRRIWSPAKIACDFSLAIKFADRGDVAVLKLMW